MKMILAVVQADDAAKVTQALIESGHRVTRIGASASVSDRHNVPREPGLGHGKARDAEIRQALA